MSKTCSTSLSPYTHAPEFRPEKWRRRQPGRLSRSAAVVSAIPLAFATTAALSPVPGPAAPLANSAVLASASTPASSPGVVQGFGDAPSLGGPGTSTSSPLVGVAPTASGQGYWLAASDGGVFSYGDAGFHGSAAGQQLSKPIVGIASTPDGGGYWLVASDGGVFSYGDARFFGSTGGQQLSKPIVGIASTPDGGGYWLVASDGGVFAFGDARFFGSTGGQQLSKPIVGMARTPDGGGYWLVASDGGVFAFGDARFFGSAGADRLTAPVVAMASTPSGQGYWLAAADGGVFAFGDAGFQGSASPEASGTQVAGMAATPSGHGYWLATAPVPPPPAQAVQASSTPGGTYLGVFGVTCYDNAGTTASGAYTNTQTVAVDPSVIPIGTHIWIAGVGERIAEDTGGAIKGDRLDIWEPTYQDCANWGYQNRGVWQQG